MAFRVVFWVNCDLMTLDSASQIREFVIKIVEIALFLREMALF